MPAIITSGNFTKRQVLTVDPLKMLPAVCLVRPNTIAVRGQSIGGTFLACVIEANGMTWRL